jgi:serine/threonine protein kinase
LETKVYEFENRTDRYTIRGPGILNKGLCFHFRHWDPHWLTIPETVPVKTSQEEAVAFSDLMRKAWEYDPDKRWTADELLSHSWLSKEFSSSTRVEVE